MGSTATAEEAAPCWLESMLGQLIQGTHGDVADEATDFFRDLSRCVPNRITHAIVSPPPRILENMFLKHVCWCDKRPSHHMRHLLLPTTLRAEKLERVGAQLRAQRLAGLNKATQTGSPIQTKSTATDMGSEIESIFISSTSMLRATVYSELANYLRMPKSETSAMQIELSFKAIPYAAMLQVFPAAETHISPDRQVTIGLIRSMEVLNHEMKMETVLPHCGMGCCKLVLPETALVGRSVLSFAPTWQIWSKTHPSGVLETMLSGFLVILDESGEMRTPPDHTARQNAGCA